MAGFVAVRIQNLELDVENPRLPAAESGGSWTQPRVLDYFAEHRNSKGLAAAIAKEGMLNPSKRLIVMRLADKKKYVVLEGNRRLAVLKLLHNPQLAPTEALKAAYRKIAKAASDLPDMASCVVVATRKEAGPWISMEHASGDEGATVKWEAMEKERFANLMRGGKTRHKKAMQLAELLQKTGHITPAEFKKIPITSLDRLLSDPYVRNSLGTDDLDEDSGDQGVQAATRIVKELAYGVVKVDDIKKKGDRKKYIDGVMKNPTKQVSVKEKVGAKNAPTKSTSSKPREQKSAWQRANLIPSDFKPKIKGAKLLEICKELKKLVVEETPNACAMLFRAFFESAIYAYMKRHNISTKSQSGQNLDSNKCFSAVKQHLEKNRTLDAATIKPVNMALSNPNHFMSVQTMHAYVHEPFVFPDKRQLNETWQAYEPFLLQILE